MMVNLVRDMWMVAVAVCSAVAMMLGYAHFAPYIGLLVARAGDIR